MADSASPNNSARSNPWFVYDQGQVILQLDGAGAVTHRLLWGPGTDQLLADEVVAADEVYWALGYRT